MYITSKLTVGFWSHLNTVHKNVQYFLLILADEYSNKKAKICLATFLCIDLIHFYFFAFLHFLLGSHGLQEQIETNAKI